MFIKARRLVDWGSMGKGLSDTIFRDKPARVLVALFNAKEETYASSIAKEIDCTYPHMVKILAGFKEHRLIEVSSSGRVKPVSLTQKGRKIAGLIAGLYTALGAD